MGKPVNRKVRLQKERVRRLSPAMLSMAVGGDLRGPEVEPSQHEFCASPDETRTDATNTCQF